ncbi:MAG: DUF2062 domain-containing protein [Casimicrobiaceae bacterium]|nr:DUF2062 domain-containing protein [Casimicrobiaceae bacterium]MCX8098322.1 DUF2062 domain-containing protein [Casimicrobiaceae bacterium]MDW8311742.1 DUF2062 domain-containing protein [Burkholderiales bacterium]
MKLRHWLRQLEPRVLAEFDRPSLAWLKPWLDRHDVFSFTREPLARGLAFGILCGTVPGPVQVIGTTLLCVLFRGNVIAGIIGSMWTNPLTLVPIYMLAFSLGALILPGTHSMPEWNAAAGASGFFSGLVDWVQALGWPLVVGLAVLGTFLAANAYALTQLAFLAPVRRRWKRMRSRQPPRGG